MAVESSCLRVPNHYQSSPLATLGASHEKLAAQRWGVGGNKTLRPLLCMLSNTCWNGGVHPSKIPLFLSSSDSSFPVSDGQTSSGPVFVSFVRRGNVYLCARICAAAASCSSGRSCRTGRRRTCRRPSSSSSSSEGPSPSRSAPPRWKGPPSPASPPGDGKRVTDVKFSPATTQQMIHALRHILHSDFFFRLQESRSQS